MNRAAVLAAPPSGCRPCWVSTIAWRLGEDLLPGVREPVRHFELWIRLWTRADTSQRRTFRDAWKATLVQLPTQGLTWQCASGGVRITILLLREVGWRPAAPDVWCNEHEEPLTVLDSTPYASVTLLDALRRAFTRKVWAGACQHFAGGGLQ